MCLKCTTLLVLLNLLSCGNMHEVPDNDRTEDQTLSDEARRLLQSNKLLYELKHRLEDSSTRHSEVSSSEKTITSMNEITTETHKKIKKQKDDTTKSGVKEKESNSKEVTTVNKNYTAHNTKKNKESITTPVKTKTTLSATKIEESGSKESKSSWINLDISTIDKTRAPKRTKKITTLSSTKKIESISEEVTTILKNNVTLKTTEEPNLKKVTTSDKKITTLSSTIREILNSKEVVTPTKKNKTLSSNKKIDSNFKEHTTPIKKKTTLSAKSKSSSSNINHSTIENTIAPKINQKPTTLSSTKQEESNSMGHTIPIEEKTTLSATEIGESGSKESKSSSLNLDVSTIDTTRADGAHQRPKRTKKTSKKTTVGTTKVILNKAHVTDDRKSRTPILNPYDLQNDLLKVMSYFPNANATAEVIGRSVEYKDIVLLKITDSNIEVKKGAREGENKLDEEENKMEGENKSEEKESEVSSEGKKIIFIVHGLSTFELWKIPCLYEETQFKLLTSYYLSHLKNFDIFIIPVANPDGFAKKDNLWNKNVSPQEDCGGVALDRNFDVAWDSRSNLSSCDQLYPGPTPFSEAESEAIKDVFLQYGKRMAAYIHVHATDNNFDYRGHTVLVPKGHTDAESDEDKYIDMKGEIDDAMRKTNFDIASVNVKTVNGWYGPVAGTSVDYASEVIADKEVSVKNHVIGVPFAMEFLMQPYEVHDIKKDLNHAALKHIWKRVIQTVFTFIHEINNSDESE